MPRYQPTWYPTPIDLPEGRHGKVRVEYRILKAGESTPIVGMRQAVLRGQRPVSANISKPLRVHQLIHDDYGLWMTDLPEELNQIGELLHTVKPAGRVLVGGLGLGILASVLVSRGECDRVVVVERDADVIALCARAGYETIHADINDYLRTSNDCFDFYLLDTWQATSEMTWWSQVMPMRRTIRQRCGRKPVVHCWAEDIMQGQIFRSLTTKPPHWYYTGLPVPMSETTARAFLRDVGLPAWERKYGKAVDTNTKREK